MTPAAAFPLPERQRISAHWDGAMAADLPTAIGTPWIAVFDGTTRTYDSGTAGHALYLRSTDGSTTAYYGHGIDPDARVVGEVRAGQVIGAVGMTGQTTGPHLHFAVTTGSSVSHHGGGNIDPGSFLEGSTASRASPATTAASEDARPVAAPAHDFGEAPTVAAWVPGPIATVTPDNLRPYLPVAAVGLAALAVLAILED